MSKKKNANKLPPFVALTYEMIDSRAFKELTGAGVKTLILFLRKVKTFHPVDRFTFQFPFTYPEAQKKGIPHASFGRALTQLIEVGFIDVVVKGGMRFENKNYSLYRLSKRWKDYGTEQFQKRWRGFCEKVHGTETQK